MQKLYILLFPLLLLSCQTNPPTQPISLKTGEVKIEITLLEDNTISTERTVLLEDFANVSCVPCVTSNKIIQSVLHSYGTNKVVAVKFPTNFPSAVDPFYLSGKEFCDFRMSYYRILFAPTIILDGLTRPTAIDSNAIKTFLNTRLAVTSDFKIAVTKIINNGGLFIKIDIKVKNINSKNLEELFLRNVIVESDIEFAQAPGSNGETKFFDVLRILSPNNEGIPLSSLSGTNSFEYENVIDTVWNLNKLEAVAFIQSSVDKDVHQAGSTF
jgi:hypothetical protein